MRTVGQVTATKGEFAIVVCKRTSACDGCHKQAEGGCSVCSLMNTTGATVKTRARNPVCAAVGDRVVLESDTSRVLWYAVLVFLLPILAVLGGYGLASCWTDEAIWRYAVAAGMFVLTFLAIRIYAECRAKRRCDVTIVEILTEHPPDDPSE